MTWDEHAIQTLKSMHAAKYSARLIADCLGTTRSAVLGKLYRLGLSTPKPPRRGRLSLQTRDPVSVEDLNG